MIAERWKFWKFEATMFTVGLAAIIVVVIRMKKLDGEYVERIHKQISSL